MDILIYFFNVQCPNCGYISFKQEKDCGSCGRILNRAATLSAPLFRNDSFTVFLSSKAAKKEQDETCLSSSQIHEEIPVIEPSQNSQENSEHTLEDFLLNLSDAEQEHSEATLKPDSSKLEVTNYSPMEFRVDAHTNPKEVKQEMQEHKSEDFLLNLSDAEQEHSKATLKPDSSKLEVTNYSPMEFRVDAHTNLQEVKQEMQEHKSEDFLLNLSDAEQEHSEATLKPDSSKLEITNYSPMEFRVDAHTNVQEEGLELMKISEEELAASATNKTKHEETQFEKLEIKDNLYKTISNEDVEFDNDGKKFESTLPSFQNMGQDITEPIAPALDLGHTEILGFEPENPAQDSALSSSRLSKLEISTNLDDTLLTEDIEQYMVEPQAPVLDLGNAEVLLESTAEDSSSPPSESTRIYG
jgi:hypothetical protein